MYTGPYEIRVVERRAKLVTCISVKESVFVTCISVKESVFVALFNSCFSACIFLLMDVFHRTVQLDP